MEEMVSQLSVMVEDLKVEKRYALSTLAGRRIREAQHAVEQAKVLVSAAVNAGESDARKRLDVALDVLAQRKAENLVEVAAMWDEAVTVTAEDAVGVDYAVDYD